MRDVDPREAEPRCRAMHPEREIHCTKYVGVGRDHEGDHEGALETWARQRVERYREEKLFDSSMRTIGWSTESGGIDGVASVPHPETPA